jgi:hypothetical protein
MSAPTPASTHAARARTAARPGWIAGVAAAVAIAMVAATPAARALTPKDRRFVSAKDGITVEAPAGWNLSTHTGYPDVLVLLLHPDGTRISISAAETTAPSARELWDENRKGLEAQGLAVVKVAPGARNGVEIEARARGRDEAIVQLYVVRPFATSRARRGARQAVVVSLFARPDLLPSRRPALDQVIAKMPLDAVDEAADGDGRPPRPAGSAGEPGAEKERR